MLLYLISQVEREDVPKIEYIYKRYHKAMMRFAKARLKHADVVDYEIDAEDVVQNAFLKISKYIKKIDFGVSEKELKAYVLTVVSNEARSFIEDYKHVESLDEEYIGMTDKEFFDSISIKENYEKAVKAIEQMDEKYSITLMYRYSSSMSVKEIADLMGISEKTVYTRISRGKQKLLEMLGGKKNV